MIRRLFWVLVLSCVAPVWAQAPQAPAVAANAYLLLDVTSGQELAGKDMDAAVEPGSLTKLMTAYVVFDALRSQRINPEQTLPMSEQAWKMPGARMFVGPNMQIAVQDLLKAMIVQSANDAAMALAEGVGGSAERFVKLMNDQAQVLGMKGTRYLNPVGLPQGGHTTTARDLGLLASRLLRDFPTEAAIFSLKKYHYPQTPSANENNRNTLLFRDPSVDGLNTGFTETAGYGVAATARRDVPGVGQRRLLAVVLGASSEATRAIEAQKLLNWGFSAFDAVKLFEANQAVVTVPVWKGQRSTVGLGLPQNIVVAVPAGASRDLTTEVVHPDPLIAPLRTGQPIGTLLVKRAGQLVAQVPLQVLQGVEQAGVLGRAWDVLRLWIK